MASELNTEIDLELHDAPPNLEGTQQFFKKKVNQKIEYLRKHLVDDKNTALFQHELLRTDREAYDFLELPLEEQNLQKTEDWPYLEAGIGIDYYRKENRYVQTLPEAAEVIDDKARGMESLLTQTRKERKTINARIERSKSREQAAKIYLKFYPQYNERLRND